MKNTDSLEYVNRRGSNSYKWDSDIAKNNLPLWVADMDFKAAEPIRKAMQQRLDHGVFGYSIVPQEYFNAVSNWFSRRHGWNNMHTENMIPTIGIVPAISAVLKALSFTVNQQLRVVTFTPAYNCFFSCISNMETQLLECKLLNQEQYFVIDREDLQQKIQMADVFLFCNPHNPTGRVWTKDEIEQIARMCEENDVFVISDEIHCEFIMPNYKYTPYATIAKKDNYCILTSASKAFNIAGLQCANIYVPNKKHFAAIDRAINIHEVCDLNPFGVVATIAAYNESEDWLKALNEHIYHNYQLLKLGLSQMPKLKLTKQEGTYLAWVDISDTGLNSEQFCQKLIAEQGVIFNTGQMYGDNNYIRINLATSLELLLDAINRLRVFVNKLS